MNVLSLSCVFPAPDDPGRGLFVRSRLLHMAALANLKVLAPVRCRPGAGIPRRRQDGPMEVIYPAWVYPPGTGAIIAGVLFARLLPQVLRLKKRFGFEVIDSHFGFPEGIAACLLSAAARTPFAVTLRGSESVHCAYPFRRAAMAWALRRAAVVIAVSRPLRDLALELGVAPSRTVVIPNGVDASVFRPRDPVECRRKHGLTAERKLILTAGHLIELKGHHLAIGALRAALDGGVDAELAIAGGSPSGGVSGCEQKLRELASALGLKDRVRFLGALPQPALAEVMCAADVFCLASSREGWPNVLHEAMACGTPVVATRVGAVPEMIPSASLGIVVPPGDAAALAAGFVEALGRTWNRGSIASWAQARSWEQVARETVERLSRALEEGEQAATRRAAPPAGRDREEIRPACDGGRSLPRR